MKHVYAVSYVHLDPMGFGLAEIILNEPLTQFEQTQAISRTLSKDHQHTSQIIPLNFYLLRVDEYLTDE